MCIECWDNKRGNSFICGMENRRDVRVKRFIKNGVLLDGERILGRKNYV